MFGDPWEVNAKHEIQYPLLFGMVRPSPVNGTKEVIRIEFYVCDLTKPDKTNEVHVLSDTKLIANDVITYFKGANFGIDFDLNESVTFEPFVESFDDNVSGWSFEVDFEIPFEWDLCSVPVSGLPSGTNPNDVSIVDQNNNVIATIPAGGYYTVEVLQQIIDTITNNTSTIIQPL